MTHADCTRLSLVRVWCQGPVVKVRRARSAQPPSPCFDFSPLLESEPSLPNAGPMLTSQFIILNTVLKSHIMMLDSWISTDFYLFVYLCQ